ncbi:DNA-binding response regulator [Cryptosporangium sp. NPDC048952]|uniref:helix-turn-helix transcriptional regulator n=1 Tax=Cryptosporangium sp. NPDC048952 TaxID=3363961 RepID=UPI0037224CCE
MLRVAVADPLPIFRHGVQAALAEAGFPTESPENLLAWVGVDEPRLALFTVQTAEDWALLPELCRVRAETKILAVLDEASVHTYVRALSAGAAGVLPRTATPPVLREVFNAAVRGSSLVPTAVLRALAENASYNDGTTESGRPSSTERDWLRQLAHGDSVAQIATRAGYSERMMFRLLRALYTKLEVDNRTEALIKGRDEGWL